MGQLNFQLGNLKIENNYMKFQQLLKSKTLWVSLATICTSLGMFFSGEQDMQELSLAVVGVIFGIVRFYTDKSLGAK